jgi:hypothetical protein
MKEQNISVEKCMHHEAVDIRLAHLEGQIRNIQRMFAAILAGIIINLTMQYMTIRHTVINDAKAEQHQPAIPGEKGICFSK